MDMNATALFWASDVKTSTAKSLRPVQFSSAGGDNATLEFAPEESADFGPASSSVPEPVSMGFIALVFLAFGAYRFARLGKKP